MTHGGLGAGHPLPLERLFLLLQRGAVCGVGAYVLGPGAQVRAAPRARRAGEILAAQDTRPSVRRAQRRPFNSAKRVVITCDASAESGRALASPAARAGSYERWGHVLISLGHHDRHTWDRSFGLEGRVGPARLSCYTNRPRRAEAGTAESLGACRATIRAGRPRALGKNRPEVFWGFMHCRGTAREPQDILDKLVVGGAGLEPATPAL
jgi:hypothetical protein